MEEKKILQIELFNFFKQKLRFIFILTFIFSLSAIIYSLSITNYYSSSAILSESENNMSNPSLSSGIGNLIGFNISQNSPLNKYSLEMKSLDFFSILYNNEEFLKNLVALDAYDRNQEKNLYDKDIFDVKNNKWHVNKDVSSKPHMQNAHGILLKDLDLDIDYDMNVLEVTFKSISPVASQYILETLIIEFNKYKKNQKELKGKEAIEHLENLLSSSSRSSIKDLASEVIRRELEKSAYADIPSYNFLEIIQSPYMPLYKSGPNRPLIVILFTIFGFLLSLFVVVIRNFFEI